MASPPPPIIDATTSTIKITSSNTANSGFAARQLTASQTRKRIRKQIYKSRRTKSGGSGSSGSTSPVASLLRKGGNSPWKFLLPLALLALTSALVYPLLFGRHLSTFDELDKHHTESKHMSAFEEAFRTVTDREEAEKHLRDLLPRIRSVFKPRRFDEIEEDGQHNPVTFYVRRVTRFLRKGLMDDLLRLFPRLEDAVDGLLHQHLLPLMPDTHRLEKTHKDTLIGELSDAWHRARKGASDARNTVRSYRDKADAAIDRTVKSAESTLRDKALRAKQTLTGVEDDVRKTKNAAHDTGKKVVQDAANHLKSTGKNARQAAQEASSHVKATADSAVRQVKDSARNQIHHAQRVAEDAKESVEDFRDDILDEGRRVKKQLQQTSKHAEDAAKEWATDHMNSAKEWTKENVDAARAHADELASHVKHVGKDVRKQVDDVKQYGEQVYEDAQEDVGDMVQMFKDGLAKDMERAMTAGKQLDASAYKKGEELRERGEESVQGLQEQSEEVMEKVGVHRDGVKGFMASVKETVKQALHLNVDSKPKHSVLHLMMEDAMDWDVSTTPIPISKVSVILKNILARNKQKIPAEFTALASESTVDVDTVRQYVNRRKLDRIRELCDYSASSDLAPNCDFNERDPEFGVTPLHLAYASGHAETIAYMQAHGADNTIEDFVHRKPQNLSFSSFVRHSRTHKPAGSSCDLPAVDMSSMSVDAAWKEVARLISEGEPVLVRNMLRNVNGGGDVMSTGAHAFVEKHGKLAVTVGSVPYADVFNLVTEELTLKNYYELHVKQPQSLKVYDDNWESDEQQDPRTHRKKLGLDAVTYDATRGQVLAEPTYVFKQALMPPRVLPSSWTACFVT